MPTKNSDWVDFAVLQASSGGKEWKVQINPDGHFRCSCPSFIFSKLVPKTCKHAKRCSEQWDADGRPPVSGVAIVSSKPLVNPLLKKAEELLSLMVSAGLSKNTGGYGVPRLPEQAWFTEKGQGKAVGKAMVETLAAQLALFNPAAIAPVAAPESVGGVRRIIFDD